MAHDGLDAARFDAIVSSFDTPAAEAPAAPAYTPPAASSLDVDALVRLVEQSQRVTAAIAKDDVGSLPAWTRGDVAKVGYWAGIVPTLVTGCANLAAHQWGPFGPALTGGLVSTALAALTVMGLNNHWSPTAVAVTVGGFLGTSSFALSAGSGGWMEVVSWLVSAGAVVAYKLVWNRKHAKDRAEVELVKMKTRTERLKGDAVQSSAALKDTYLLLKIQEAQRAATAAATPVAAATPEEAAVRNAVRDVFRVELLSCNVRPIRTGWVATVGLPVELPRNTAKAAWDKVSSALRANGRFVVTDGRLTNEINVKFLDNDKIDTSPIPWSPDVMPEDRSRRACIGINTETGDHVTLHFAERLLVCGASGTGKSWATRPLLAHAHLNGWLVLLDGKGEEGNIWDAVCRVARDTGEIVDLIEAVHAEMNHRKRLMAERGISVWDGEQITFFVDEGQVVLAAVKSDPDLMQKLRELASLGRSRGIVVWWATQKPTMSDKAPGIDSQMAGNLLQRFSLRVASEQEARTALDDCAHYGPQAIPDGDDLRGNGYLKGYGASMIRSWTMDDEAVKALPRKVWKGTDERRATIAPSDLVARYLAENPGASQRDIAKATDIPRATVQRILKDA